MKYRIEFSQQGKKELKKLDDVVEQKYGNINLREVDLLPDM